MKKVSALFPFLLAQISLKVAAGQIPFHAQNHWRQNGTKNGNKNEIKHLRKGRRVFRGLEKTIGGIQDAFRSI